MALSILDGTQTATTLSTILSSGQHITAHTVVSLGTQAITDMRGAVSGSVVSISNFPASQVISGTVTANPTGTQTIAGTVTVANSLTVSDITNAVVFGINDYIFASDSFPISGSVIISSALPTGTNRIGVVTIGGGSVTLGASTSQIGSVTASISGTVPISISSVTVGNSVTIGSLPAISGTVTANGGDFTGADVDITPTRAVQIGFTQTNGSGDFVVVNNDNRPFPVQVFGYNYQEGGTPQIPVKWDNSDQNYIPIGPSVDPIPLPISGTVTANISAIYEGEASFSQADYPMMAVGGLLSGFNEIRPITIDPNTGGQIVAGTVTANSSNGSLTTRFGSVTTANTAFATSSVTNTNRKYLLIQNITTASNVITVGIGFTPTTTQGIQLFAGAGLTFEGSYIPTGAVNLLSSVTASCYTILEA